MLRYGLSCNTRFHITAVDGRSNCSVLNCCMRSKWAKTRNWFKLWIFCFCIDRSTENSQRKILNSIKKIQVGAKLVGSHWLLRCPNFCKSWSGSFRSSSEQWRARVAKLITLYSSYWKKGGGGGGSLILYVYICGPWHIKSWLIPCWGSRDLYDKCKNM